MFQKKNIYKKKIIIIDEVSKNNLIFNLLLVFFSI